MAPLREVGKSRILFPLESGTSDLRRIPQTCGSQKCLILKGKSVFRGKGGRGGGLGRLLAVGSLTGRVAGLLGAVGVVPAGDGE
jgi:hypothetical protein